MAATKPQLQDLHARQPRQAQLRQRAADGGAAAPHHEEDVVTPQRRRRGRGLLGAMRGDLGTLWFNMI